MNYGEARSIIEEVLLNAGLQEDKELGEAWREIIGQEYRATILNHYSCGCGFVTDNPEIALKHSEDKKHILTVLGSVRPK